MCGITGFISPSPKPESDLKKQIHKMARAINHRGPDGEGYWQDKDFGVALGHKRLSIVDLSPTGAQPMHSTCGQLVMVYNGEVYNAPELSKDLIKTGAKFRGTSDSEVILEGFSQWGIHRTLEKLVGMFAIAIWNKQSKELYLIRDRLGIKPLYWTHTKGELIFASELKALKQHPLCPTTINDNATANYMRKGYIGGSTTIYKNVQKLLPGNILRFKAKESPEIKPFWSLREVVSNATNDQYTGTFDEAKEHLTTILKDAVQKRMLSDVPLGSFLSGGIDSSLVAAIMQSHSSSPVRTFSIGFNESKFNEAPHAAAVAQHLGTDHTEMYVSPSDAFEVIPNLPTIFDEPFSDPSQIPTYLLSKLTREHVTVALSGDGGDELFAGYDRYFTANAFAKLLRQPTILRKLQANLIDSVSMETANRISKVLPKNMGKHLAGHKLQRISPALHDGKITTLYHSVLSHKQQTAMILRSGTESVDIDPEFPTGFNTKSNIALLQYIDTLDYLPNDILTKVDRASMAVSLEARVPLIDHRVVEFSWRLPHKYKVDNGTGKHILKEILYQYVPRELLDRPKMGFSVPIGEWLRGPLQTWAEDLLTTDALNSTEVFNTDYVRNIWQQHQSLQVNWEFHLWDILNLQSWLLETKRIQPSEND